MNQIFDSLLPLALLVALGAALLRLRFFDDAFRKGLDRLVYWVALPALIVRVLAEAPSSEVLGSAGAMVVTLCSATVAIAAGSWVVAKLIRRPDAEAGVFTQAAFRGNLAFVGLPVITLAVGAGETGSAILAKAALVFAPTVVLYNVLGVAALIAAQHRFDASLPVKMIKSLITNPLLLACVAGLLVWYFEVGLPAAALTTLDLVGKPAAPLALISLGGALVTYPVGKRLGTALLASALKCGATPLVAWLIAGWWGLSADDRLVVLIFAACPTAVASYVLATQLKGDPALAAATIVLSTLLSAVSLGVVLGLA
ncbi:MAG: AEC family transporter [Planctomycetota bacterium]